MDVARCLAAPVNTAIKPFGEGSDDDSMAALSFGEVAVAGATAAPDSSSGVIVIIIKPCGKGGEYYDGEVMVMNAAKPCVPSVERLARAAASFACRKVFVGIGTRIVLHCSRHFKLTILYLRTDISGNPS